MSATVLGFDVGQRKIGVAVANTLTRSGQPLEVLLAEPSDALWPRVDQLLRQWRPERVVVGLPLTLAGESQSATVRAEQFRLELARRFGVHAIAVDERMSTQEARRRFAELRRKGLARRGQNIAIDALAAAVILEDHLATAQC